MLRPCLRLSTIAMQCVRGVRLGGLASDTGTTSSRSRLATVMLGSGRLGASTTGCRRVSTLAGSAAPSYFSAAAAPSVRIRAPVTLQFRPTLVLSSRIPPVRGLGSSALPPRALPGKPHPPARTSLGGGGGSGRGGGARRFSGGGGGTDPEGTRRSGLWAAYLSLLERYPLMTKALTAGVLNGIGDVVAQRLISPDEPFDVQRLQVFVLVGAALVGPGLHLWYGTLARLAAAVGAAGSGGTFFRVACDQLLFAPMFLSLIVGSVMTLEGHPGLAVQDKLRRDLFAILRSNWAVWVPFQLFNFRFVPLQLQVLSSNIVALAFNVYLSYVSHK